MTLLISYYLFLLFFTFLFFRNAYISWKLTGDFTLPICTFILYYFTLAGGLIFPIDYFCDFKGTAIGLNYLPIFDRLFRVNFDSDYFIACACYVAFIAVFQYTYLALVRRSIAKNKINFSEEKSGTFELVLNPIIVLAISLVLIFVSFYILRREIFYAIANEKSIYLITRANKNPYYTIHQLANEFCVLIPFLAYTFTIIKSDSYKIKVQGGRTALFILFFTCTLASLYISFLGNRREILSGMVVCTVVSLNQFRNINYKRFGSVVLMVLVFFVANGFFRSTVIPKQLHSASHVEAQAVELQEGEEFTTKGVAGSFVFSNELFYAHFSMYGVLKKDVPLTYGSSFKYLATSIIPRSIYPDRPPDIYNYYATSVNAVPGQIYTLHHATAWYLNFGFVGIILGAVLLACVFAFAFYVNHFEFKTNNTFVILLKYFLPFLFCAQLVTFITSGPEAYKSFILEGVVIPLVLLMLCIRKRIPEGSKA